MHRDTVTEFSKLSYRGLMRLLLVVLVSAAAAACSFGPSVVEVEQIVNKRMATAIAGIPTVTPAPLVATATPVTFPNTSTPAPTTTPVLTPTPQPTPTLQPKPTPFRLPPTATPQPTVTPRPPEKTFNDVFNEYQFSVFRIETSDGMGTGWLIEPGLVLTNQHVVQGYTTVSVRQNQRSPFPARVRAVDQPRDIALLSFDVNQTPLDPRAKPLPIGDVYQSDIASSMMAMGYSGGLTADDDGTIGPATANIGVLSGIVYFVLFDVNNLVIDAAVDPGDSGGPVLDIKGEVVGMTRAAQTNTGSGQRVVGTFYAVHWNEIARALPDLKRGISR